jgi:hypothetical protein
MEIPDKAYYLALINKQSQQMRQLGFLGSPGAAALAQTEAQLEELDLNTLKAIARAARNLLGAARLPTRVGQTPRQRFE